MSVIVAVLLFYGFGAIVFAAGSAYLMRGTDWTPNASLGVGIAWPVVLLVILLDLVSG